jgi:hypothetical protein
MSRILIRSSIAGRAENGPLSSSSLRSVSSKWSENLRRTNEKERIRRTAPVHVILSNKFAVIAVLLSVRYLIDPVCLIRVGPLYVASEAGEM